MKTLMMLLVVLGAGDEKAERAKVDQALAAVRAAAKAAGCTEVAQCRTVPSGSRACGGPQEYVVYCSKSTDEAKLKAKAKAATDAQSAFNSKFQLSSICAVVAQPELKLEKGVCKASAGRPADAIQ